MQHEHVHVAPAASARSTFRWPGRQPRQPEQRQPRRQVDDLRLLAQPRARALDPLGRIGHADPRAQPPPQLGLPRPARRHVPVLAPRPRAHHLGPVQRVAIEQLGEVPNRAEPPRPPRRVGVLAAATEMRGQAREPRLVEVVVDHLEQSPHRPLGQPRIRVGLDPRRRRHRVADEPPRRREVDVRAHAVAPPLPGAEPIRHPLREPALHPARRHGDDLGRERVGQRVGQQRAKRLDEAVGPLGSMDVKHVGESAWRTAWIEATQ